jgi:Zn-dependent protease
VKGLSVGRAFGIPIRFHWSWLLLFALVSWSLAATFGLSLGGAGSVGGLVGRRFGRPVPLPPVIPGLGRFEGLLVLGVVTAALFCISLLAHELAHSLVARRHGIRVRGITLFFFGGVAEIASLPKTPGAEFRVAIVGPLTSLALAGLFWVISVVPALPPTLTEPCSWLARTNLALAAFNLLPGFPLDGGRVFRSVIWQLSGSPRRATHVAAGAGRLVGYGFMAWGVFSIFTGGLAGGLWQLFIGTILQSAARNQAAHADFEHALDGLTVGHALGPEPLSASGPVRVSPRTDLLEALHLMEETGASQVLVEDDGRVLGVLTRERVAGYLRMRRELNRPA